MTKEFYADSLDPIVFKLLNEALGIKTEKTNKGDYKYKTICPNCGSDAYIHKNPTEFHCTDDLCEKYGSVDHYIYYLNRALKHTGEEAEPIINALRVLSEAKKSLKL